MRARLFVFGIAILMVGFALVAVGSLDQGGASAGGFILIGPIPIVFGTGGNGTQLALLSVIAGVLLALFIALWARRLAT